MEDAPFKLITENFQNYIEWFVSFDDSIQSPPPDQWYIFSKDILTHVD